jgi:hypothetical protein
MINFIVYLFAGLLLACWILCVIDKDLKALFKLIISVALACFIGVVDSIYPLNILTFLVLIIACMVAICFYALCKAAKE